MRDFLEFCKELGKFVVDNNLVDFFMTMFLLTFLVHLIKVTKNYFYEPPGVIDCSENDEFSEEFELPEAFREYYGKDKL